MCPRPKRVVGAAAVATRSTAWRSIIGGEGRMPITLPSWAPLILVLLVQILPKRCDRAAFEASVPAEIDDYDTC